MRFALFYFVRALLETHNSSTSNSTRTQPKRDLLRRHDVGGLALRTSLKFSLNVYKRRFPRYKKTAELEEPAATHGSSLSPEDDQDGEDSAPEEPPGQEGPCGPGTLPERAGPLLQLSVSGGL